jgi:hypothetical protein
MADMEEHEANHTFHFISFQGAGFINANGTIDWAVCRHSMFQLPGKLVSPTKIRRPRDSGGGLKRLHKMLN